MPPSRTDGTPDPDVLRPGSPGSARYDHGRYELLCHLLLGQRAVSRLRGRVRSDRRPSAAAAADFAETQGVRNGRTSPRVRGERQELQSLATPGCAALRFAGRTISFVKTDVVCGRVRILKHTSILQVVRACFDPCGFVCYASFRKIRAMKRSRNHLILIACLVLSVSGCAASGRKARKEQLTACQLRSQELFAENEQLLLAQQQQQQIIAGLEQDRAGLSQHIGQIENQLATANSRIDNLLAERGTLKDRYAQALTDTKLDSFPTASGPHVPGFEFDPLTGLSKFPEDVLFDLGSAELRPEAFPVLKEFADQVNSPSANGLRILVVGHTDDQQIARAETARKHPTNWHLSTDRADEVIVELEKLGVSAERLSAMGYSRFQPLEAGADEHSRQRNRRVELYIVPDTVGVTAWDPVKSLR